MCQPCRRQQPDYRVPRAPQGPRGPVGCANPRCQATIESPRHGQRWCSRQCRERVQERVDSGPEWVRGRNARKNEKRAGDGRGWTVQRLRPQVQAEEPDCWICHDPIDPAKRWPDPMCFTVDHVIPVEDGGSDDRANLRASHRICNQRRHVEWRRAQRERRRMSA